MLKIRNFLIITILLILALFICPSISLATSDTSVTITFYDENLYNALLSELSSKIESNETSDGLYYITMTQDNIDSVKSLSLIYEDITDIEGLDKFTNLTYLDLSSNSIKDITGLENLSNLTYLYLSSNNIKDTTALSSLTNLTYLNLYSNSVEDITGLESLINLTELHLSSNSIKDITALSSLTNLTYLDLNSNSIEDITAIGNLINLTYLDISHNNIEDMEVLEDMGIEKLTCSYQEIYVTASDYKVELPQIFLQAQDSDSIFYMEDDGGLYYSQCRANEEDYVESVTITKVYQSTEVSVYLLGRTSNRNNLIYRRIYYISKLYNKWKW